MSTKTIIMDLADRKHEVLKKYSFKKIVEFLLVLINGLLPSKKSLFLSKLYSEGLLYRTIEDELENTSPIIQKICRIDEKFYTYSVRRRCAIIEEGLKQAEIYGSRPLKTLTDIILRPSVHEVMAWYETDFTIYWMAIKSVVNEMKRKSSPRRGSKDTSAVLEKLADIIDVVRHITPSSGRNHFLRISTEDGCFDNSEDIITSLIESGATYNQVLMFAMSVIKRELREV